MKNRILIKILAYTSIICGIFLQNAQALNNVENLRNQRYCEVLLQSGPMSLAVYNTIGLNQCPEEQWQRLTPELIQKTTNAKFVHLNGPRYWVIDGILHPNLINPNIRNFGGLQMREAGILRLSLKDIITHGNKPYTQRKVVRKPTWIYSANKPVYALFSPEGLVYVMQSYSVEKVSQTIESLANLGKQLKLPKAWKFCTQVLPKIGYLTAVDGEAIVIQDDFLNTYQLQVDNNFINMLHCS